MDPTFGEQLTEILTTLVTLALVIMALGLLLRRLGRSRPELAIGLPIVVALTVRVVGAMLVSLTGLGSTLRGGDEIAFTFRADLANQAGVGSDEWIDTFLHELHVFVIAVQDTVLDSPDMALRVTEAGIAVAGLALIATAVFDLAGKRASWVAAWLLALEPGGAFFSGLIHKEAIMFFAIGLVCLGGARMWTRAEYRSLLPMVAGCLIAAMTRGYASWFLLAAAAAITFHTSLRGVRVGSGRSLMTLSAVVLGGALIFPVVTGSFAAQNLQQLDVSQTANTRDTSNLQLEAVDFSSGSGIVSGLPQRIRDLLLRPYPWQLGNLSQQIGLLGTLSALAILFIFVVEVRRNRGQVFRRAGPLLYIGLALLLAYALTVGNAGTGFRYRTQVLAVGAASVAALGFATARRRDPQLDPALLRPRSALAGPT